MNAKYEKADLPAIIRENCSHLTASDREKLLSVLLKFEVLFNGTLGDWKLPPVFLYYKIKVSSLSSSVLSVCVYRK